MSANLLFRRGKRVLIGFAVVVLALALNPVAGLGAETIKIGVIDDFSGPASAAFGQPALLGWRMAVEEVNNSGGLERKTDGNRCARRSVFRRKIGRISRASYRKRRGPVSGGDLQQCMCARSFGSSQGTQEAFHGACVQEREHYRCKGS